MTESRRPYSAQQPEPIDDNEDRMGSLRELDFDAQEPGARQQPPSSPVRKRAPSDDEEADSDDLSPAALIPEDGARDAWEAGEDEPADWDLSIVDAAGIGGGDGLDEAELARRDPLDGQRRGR